MFLPRLTVAKPRVRGAAADTVLRGLLLVAALAGTECALALDSDAGAPVPAAGERSLVRAISQIESRDGAYAAQLPEQMLSLGLALQEQQRHAEAVAAFKRGVHLARVNNGLYCQEQIPMLLGEIKSYIALGQYSAVDELQEYLFRVQSRSMASGEDRAKALIQQGNWQFNAYRLDLGGDAAGRLMRMWELYQLALSDIAASQGETSLQLLPALHGLLRTEYLISDYREANRLPGNSFSAEGTSQDLNRFYGYLSRNYERGRSVISAIYDVQRVNKGADSMEAAQALVALGDWALWNGKRNEAVEIYRGALAELAQSADAQQEQPSLLGEPVPLPDLKGLRSLPPAVSPEQGDILVEFGVDSRGKVVDLVRLDTDEDNDTAANRLMRELRGTQFRPRFEAGEPAETEKLVRAYDIDP